MAPRYLVEVSSSSRKVTVWEGADTMVCTIDTSEQTGVPPQSGRVMDQYVTVTFQDGSNRVYGFDGTFRPEA